MLTRTFLKMILPVSAAFAAPVIAADTNPPWVISGASNAPNIAIFDAPTTTLVKSFPVLFTGGVRVAGGDLDGDGAIDIVAGSSTQAQVKVFSGPLYMETLSFSPFGAGFQPGVHLAAGHVTGTAPLDIVAGAGAGSSPDIKVFSAKTGLQQGDTISAFQSAFVGGVRVATGDVNGDGFADIIAGTGSNGVAVEIFSGKDHQRLLPSLQAPFNTAASDGLYVAGGDVDADGFADIIVGRGADSADINADIKVFSGKSGDPIRDFTAFQEFVGGVRVGSADINGDGFADIIAGQGPGGGTVTIFSGKDLTSLGSFKPFGDSFTGGIFPAGLSVVPEPSSIALFACGLVAMLMLRRRAHALLDAAKQNLRGDRCFRRSIQPFTRCAGQAPPNVQSTWPAPFHDG